MKKIFTLIVAMFMAIPAMAAPPKKPEPKKPDNKKEMPAKLYTVIVDGASADEGVTQVKGFLSAMKGVEVKDCTMNGKSVEATISTKERIGRADISKAFKDKKELVVKEFKEKRPEKPGDKKKDEPKKDEPKKDDAKKTT